MPKNVKKKKEEKKRKTAKLKQASKPVKKIPLNKPIQKAVQKKTVLSKKPVLKSVPSIETPKILETRPAKRTIIGQDSVARVVEMPAPIIEKNIPQPIAIVPKKVLPPTPPAAKVPWSELPRHFPPHLKFLLNMAERECNNLEHLAFPFAKFIYSLPRVLCGLEFALLLLSLEHETEAIGRLCRMEIDTVEKSIEHGRSVISGAFSDMCGELDRKWWGSHRSGSGRTVESLVEPYVVSKIDRNLQLLVGAVLLQNIELQTTVG